MNVAGIRTLEDCSVVVVVVVEVTVEADVDDVELVDGAAAAAELAVADAELEEVDELGEPEWLDPPHAPIIRKMGITRTTPNLGLTRSSINADTCS
jgi:uncharacterized protein (UPF0179 family)